MVTPHLLHSLTWGLRLVGAPLSFHVSPWLLNKKRGGEGRILKQLACASAICFSACVTRPPCWRGPEAGERAEIALAEPKRHRFKSQFLTNPFIPQLSPPLSQALVSTDRRRNSQSWPSESWQCRGKAGTADDGPQPDMKSDFTEAGADSITA